MSDYSRLPGDLQIEIAIQRLGYGSPCQPKVIAAKIAALRAEMAADEAHRQTGRLISAMDPKKRKHE